MTVKSKRRRRRERMLETLILTTFGTVFVTLVLALGYVYINFDIHKNQHSVEALSKELVILQEEVNEAKLKQDEYKKQVEQLQAQLAKYQEVVIPESMVSP